ncbi:MAG: hypothetical protein KAY22_19450 [Rhizorhabdus sp.]|uniref:hypothetical protein n=1 Tax=Rhizorhabdus sp. TaxID=1968843 RepID=UPI001B65C14F|nr:hypothetical protein [Rhizorhabdus sp.]MBP8234474.1 hypothetical protein [Rhizorhabdus sp.]
MKPTIGRIVLYRVSGQDAIAINQRRKDAQEKLAWHHALRSGAQVHVGNAVKEGDVYPLIITKVWGDSEKSAFNGQLLLDGNDLFWVTSTSLGDRPRECFWPPRANASGEPASVSAGA